MFPSTRREALLLGASVTGWLAGCTGTDTTPTATGGNAPTAGDGEDVNLREANVVAVGAKRGDGTVSFDVTLHHDDDGEDGYANWWQIESLGGDRLGRRVLAHPHTSQPFTRSESYEIPVETACVVVRGHDETHGYGGQAMLVDLDSGATRPFRQGSSRRPASAGDCP